MALGSPRELSSFSPSELGLPLEVLQAQGFRCILESEFPVWQLAAQAADAAIGTTVEPDVVLFCSDSLHAEADDTSLTEFVSAVGLHSVPLTLVAGNGCANVGIALLLGRALIAAGDAEHVLIVTADRRRHGDPIALPDGQAVLSDGAAAVFLTRDHLADALAVGHVTTAAELPDERTSGYPTSNARLTARLVSRCLNSEPPAVSPVDRIVVVANLGATSRAFIASAGRLPPATICVGDVARCGHAFGADILCTLESLRSRQILVAGRAALALFGGWRTWVAVQVEGA